MRTKACNKNPCFRPKKSRIERCSVVLRAIKYLFLVVSSGQNVVESIVNVGTRLSRQQDPLLNHSLVTSAGFVVVCCWDNSPPHSKFLLLNLTVFVKKVS